MIVGGGIANTFMAANGNRVGKSLCEHGVEMQKIYYNRPIFLYRRCCHWKRVSSETNAEYKMIDDINENDMIFDIGEKTQQNSRNLIFHQKLYLEWSCWVFEFEKFSSGTKTISEV